MPYSVIISIDAQNDLKNLPQKINLQIGKRIDALTFELYPASSMKLKGYDHLRRIRSGDYRIIYEIHHSKNVVEVLRVRSRKDAYRNL